MSATDSLPTSTMSKRGKLVAIEGTDGSGKATQFKLLVAALKHAGHKVATVDFPQYGKASAKMVEEYLRGKFGKASDVGPYDASLFYAIDRLEAAPRIRRWLSEGRTVVANRYTWSNAHQAGKIKSAAARRKFWRWALALEHEAFGIPKPDVTIFLHMPAAQAQALVDKKHRRAYLRGKKRDIHEGSLGHLKAAERTYIELVKRYHFRTVLCSVRGRVLPPDAIHKLVMQELHRFE